MRKTDDVCGTGGCGLATPARRRLVQAGFHRCFGPSFNVLKASLTVGELGRARSHHIVNRDPRRPLVLSDAAIAEVFARGANLLHDEAMRQAGDIDTVMINLALTDATLASIDCMRESGYGYDQRIEVLGEMGGMGAENVVEVSPTRPG
ncbi:MAG: hypothetical protein ACNYPI_07620 [Arenicellales bacterium WSBS_2016_MAG_OTU3]